MLVYELKEYTLLSITPDTELEDYSGLGKYRYFPHDISDTHFFASTVRYQLSGVVDFSIAPCFEGDNDNMYSADWCMHNISIIKFRICRFAPETYARLRIVEKL